MKSKILAILAVVAMLCSLLPLGGLTGMVASAATSSDNLIVNGGFESGESNWTFSSGTHEIVSDAHTGSQAVKLTAPGQYGSAALQYVTVEPGATYIIKWWSKQDGSVFNLYFVNTHTVVAGQAWMSDTSNTWKENMLAFTVGAGVTSIGVKFSTEKSDNTANLILDDVTMVKVTSSDTTNGDFETGTLDSWTGEGAAITTSDVHGGTYAASCTHSTKYGRYLQQELHLTKEKNYTLSFWAKCSSGSSGSFRVYLTTNTGSETSAGSTIQSYSTFTATSTWQKFEVSFTATKAVIYAAFRAAAAGSSVFLFDDVTVIQERDPSFDGYLYNGDFECGKTSNWTTTSAATVTIDAAAAHDGNYGAHINGNGSYNGFLSQTITVEAGKTYEATLWYKAVTRGLNIQFVDSTWNGTKLVTSANNSTSTWLSNTEWTQVTYTMTALSDKIFINFCGSGSTGSADATKAEEFYLDSFVITEVKDPSFDGYIYNGDFETGKLPNWTGHQSTVKVSTTAAYEGMFGLIAEGNGGWGGLLTQSFTVKANTDYTVRYMIKTLQQGLNVQVKDSAGSSNLYYKYHAASEGTDWRLIEATFNSGNNTTVTFQLVGSGLNTTSGGQTPSGLGDIVYFDNISISKVGGEDPIAQDVLTGGQVSIRDVNQGNAALAFRFQVKTSGATVDGFNRYQADGKVIPWDDEAEYTLVRVGAVMTNSATIGKDADALTLDNVDAKKTINVEGVYLCEVEADYIAFAVRIVNIPDAGKDTNIYARPYYVYEDGEGNEVTMYGETKSDNYNHVANPKASIKVLAIGNSFSVDAMNNHLYSVLKDGGYEEVVLGNLYIGGCSLDTHWTNMNNDSGAYKFYKTSDGTWKTTESYKVSTALAEEDWDYITIQQASPNSGQPGTYGNLNNILEYINENKTNPNAKILWHMTWAYDETNTNSGYSNYDNDQLTMYAAITNTVNEKVLTNSLIDGVIPAGTAIQNMRNTSLTPSLLCSSDGYHLSDSYGDYIAALTWYAYFSGDDVSALTYETTELSAYRDEVNEAVMSAISDPYQITKVTYDQTKSIKVLSIGHSFSIDVMGTYLYNMLQQAGYTDITLGYVYYPGCPLKQHWEWIESHSQVTGDQGNGRYAKNTNGSWTTIAQPPYTIDALRDEDWDYVTFQASPDYVGGDKQEYDNVTNMVNWIKSNALNANVDVKYHMIWAFSQDCELWSNMYHKDQTTGKYSQTVMYENIVKAAKQYVVGKAGLTEADIIPSGTSVQNGRTSLIGDNFNEPVVPGTQADGYHLNTKYGDFTGSLTWACYFSGKDASTITSRSDGMTETEFAAIAEAVNNALADWDNVTDSTYKN